MFDIAFVVVYLVIMAMVPTIIADSKGKEALTWFLYSLFLWPVALAHAIIAKPTLKHLEKTQLAYGLKKCPHCAEMIKPDAVLCRYCGQEQML